MRLLKENNLVAILTLPNDDDERAPLLGVLIPSFSSLIKRRNRKRKRRDNNDDGDNENYTKEDFYAKVLVLGKDVDIMIEFLLDKQKRKKERTTKTIVVEKEWEEHINPSAAAAERSYADIDRTNIESRMNSPLYYMRNYHNWVKAVQIQGTNPKTSTAKNGIRLTPLRVLDLACGKGADIGKWKLHKRGIQTYVGIDASLKSLKDAAIRTIKLFCPDNNDNEGTDHAATTSITNCFFMRADLGQDSIIKEHGKILTWSLHDHIAAVAATNKEKEEEEDYMIDSDDDEEEEQVDYSNIVFISATNKDEGGGVNDNKIKGRINDTIAAKFDIISIQFGIHYMMSTPERARHFFRTCSDSLDIGGNLIVTTVDANVILEKLMDHPQCQKYLMLSASSEEQGGDSGGKDDHDDETTIQIGKHCQIEFARSVLERNFGDKNNTIADTIKHDKEHYDDDNNYSNRTIERLSGLEYKFRLIEETENQISATNGNNKYAVNLPEWLAPIPLLKALGKEVGLELVPSSIENFHSFYYNHCFDDNNSHSNEQLLFKMKVLNPSSNRIVNHSNWDISRLYCALKFRKVSK